MPIKIKSRTLEPAVDIGHLKGTAKQLTELVMEHGDYEFEGFRWLQGRFGGIADHLGVNEKTVRRAVKEPPFHYIARFTAEDGKHVLIKLGGNLCESDQVMRLRAPWRIGLAWFNHAALQAWPNMVIKDKHAGLPYQRLAKRIEAARKWEPDIARLKAGEKISLEVKPREMGLLRECAKRFGEDAHAVIACLAMWEGWHLFTAYLKAAGRENGHFYHWPTLGPIAGHPDIALQAYLDIQQAKGKISLQESARLLAKIEKSSQSKTA